LIGEFGRLAQFKDKPVRRPVVLNMDALFMVKVKGDPQSFKREFEVPLAKAFVEYGESLARFDEQLNLGKQNLLRRFEAIKQFHSGLRSCASETQNYDIFKNFQNSAYDFAPDATKSQGSSNILFTPIYPNPHPPTNQPSSLFQPNPFSLPLTSSPNHLLKILDRPRPPIHQDPQISKLYNQITDQKFFTPNTLTSLQFCIENLDHCISLERLIMAIGCIYHEMQAILQEIDILDGEECGVMGRYGETVIGEVVGMLGEKGMEGWEVCEGVDRVFEGVEECLMAKRVGGGGGEGMERFQGSSVECRVEGGVGKGGGWSQDGSGRAQSWALQRGVANFLEKKKEFSGRGGSESKTSEISPHTISYLNQDKPKFLTAKKPNPIQTPNPKAQPSTLLKNPALLPLRRKSSSRTN
jgi:hypothetical protein